MEMILKEVGPKTNIRKFSICLGFYITADGKFISISKTMVFSEGDILSLRRGVYCGPRIIGKVRK